MRTTFRPWARTGLLAAALCGMDLFFFSDVTFDSGLDGWLAIGYAAAGFALLFLRDRAPLVMYLLFCLHGVLAYALFDGYRPIVGPLTGLYAVAVRRDTDVALLALILNSLPSVLAAQDEARSGADTDTTSTLIVVAVGYLVLASVVWGAGRRVRAHRTNIAELHRRRRQATADAVDAERTRIARELHDIVAHSVSVMVLQAAGASRVMHADPRSAETALGNIEDVGKRSMAELHRLLGLLRDARPGPFGDPEHDLGSQPGLAQLDQLIAETSAAGLRVQVHEEGHRLSLDRSVDLSAYRVIQESLTNAVKHAGAGAKVDLSLLWTDSDLRIRVVDDGGGAPNYWEKAMSTGYGLLGLRERTRAVGGDLDTGPRPAGGYRVEASLPVVSDQQATREMT